MKIYTYYQAIDFSAVGTRQQELIDLWKVSWSRQGYEPIVLNLEDAKRHPYFDTLNTEMRRIFKEITNKEIADYGMSCWFRWLAYASQEEEKFYVSDYDAININFPITEPSDKLHLMDNHVPFLASGTPKQFQNLCEAFVTVSNERLETLKQQANWYHDQDFLYYNFMLDANDSAEKLAAQYGILITRDRCKFGGQVDCVENKIADTLDTSYVNYYALESYGVAHVSHHSVRLLQDRYSEYKSISKDNLRIALIKGVLNLK